MTTHPTDAEIAEIEQRSEQNRAFAPMTVADMDRLCAAARDRNRLEAENAKLRGLLKPFADEANMWAESVPDSHRSLCTEPGCDRPFDGSETDFNVGDLRAARDFLSQLETDNG